MTIFEQILDTVPLHRMSVEEKTELAQKLIASGEILLEDVVIGHQPIEHLDHSYKFYIVAVGMDMFYIRFVNTTCTSIFNLITNSEVCYR